MLRSTERILVSHAGVLPRPAGLQRLFDAGPREREAFHAALPGAVADVVARQVAAGVDIVNDGEVSKHGLFIGYIRDRMSGFEERTAPASEFRPRNAGVTGRDSRDFPGFYAAGLGGFPVRRLVVPGQGGAPVTEYVCTGPLRYTGAADARADIDRLAAAAVAHGVEAFLPAITPGTVEHWLRNEYYPDDESFLAAIADVLHEEYKTITDAGLLLQVDDPDLPDGWQMFPDMTVPEYRRYAALRVEALNPREVLEKMHHSELDGSLPVSAVAKPVEFALAPDMSLTTALEAFLREQATVLPVTPGQWRNTLLGEVAG